MPADIHEIADTLRAVASGELHLGEAQVRAVAGLCAETHIGALNVARSLAGRPPEEPPPVCDLNAEARRNLEAARALYDSLVDRI